MPYSPYVGAPSGLIVPSTQIVPVYAAGEDRGRSFLPTDVPNLALWLDASRITGLVDGDPVANWSDLSGQGRDATQGTGAARPTYKVAILNGKPVVRFDGVDDYLKTSAFTLNQPTHVFIVLTLIAQAASAYYWDGNGQNLMAAYQRLQGLMTLYAGGNGPEKTFGNGSTHIVSALYNGSSSELRFEGGAATTGDVSTSNAGGITLGARGNVAVFANIDVAEVLIYNRALAADERQKCERYLGKKYGLAVS